MATVILKTFGSVYDDSGTDVNHDTAAFTVSPGSGVVIVIVVSSPFGNTSVSVAGFTKEVGDAGGDHVLSIFSQPDSSGGSISISISNVGMGAIAMVYEILEVQGGALLSWGDVESIAAGDSTLPNSGNTATTTQVDEVAIGAASLGTDLGLTGVWDSPWVDLGEYGQSGDFAGASLSCAWRTISLIGPYAASKTLFTGRPWHCAIATFKNAILVAPRIVRRLVTVGTGRREVTVGIDRERITVGAKAGGPVVVGSSARKVTVGTGRKTTEV